MEHLQVNCVSSDSGRNLVRYGMRAMAFKIWNLKQLLQTIFCHWRHFVFGVPAPVECYGDGGGGGVCITFYSFFYFSRINAIFETETTRRSNAYVSK